MLDKIISNFLSSVRDLLICFCHLKEVMKNNKESTVSFYIKRFLCVPTWSHTDIYEGIVLGAFDYFLSMHV